MVLMHIFRDDPETVVAHFDHGTRPSSLDDAEFVACEAARLGLPFYGARAELGPDVSEEQARISRYEYFDKLRCELGGEIYTAHHGDDLIETMAINLIRGTGWRGLAPFSRTGARRPFLETSLLPRGAKTSFARSSSEEASSTELSSAKVGSTEVKPIQNSSSGVIFRNDICRYAAEHEVVFRQDSTNADEKYLRNRVRILARNLTISQKLELVKIYHRMNNLRTEVDATVGEILKFGRFEEGDAASGAGKIPREWFYTLEDSSALELLRAILAEVGLSATRPQMLDFLKAIREYPAGRKFNLPKDRFAKIGTREFWVLG